MYSNTMVENRTRTKEELEALLQSKDFRYAVNLLWLNDKKNQDNPLHPQMDYLVAQLKKWGEGHEEAIINLWYDSQTTNERAIQSFLKLLRDNSINPNQNIRLRDIRELPEVLQNEAFFSTAIPVYFQIDILKLIICLHCMQSEGMDSAIFTDLSIGEKVSKIVDKDTLYSPDSIHLLHEFGLLLGNDGEKTENQFLQMLNTPQLIQSLTHAINASLLIATNTLNNLVTESYSGGNEADIFLKKAAAVHITTMPFYGAQSYIYSYLLSMAEKEGIQIRADIVGEGPKEEWVPYQPEKHGFIMFGNYFNKRKLETFYYDSHTKEYIPTKDFIKIPDRLKINPIFKSFADTFNQIDCVVDNKVVRHDLNPGHFGRSHEWHGNFSYVEISHTPLPFKNSVFSPSPTGQISLVLKDIEGINLDQKVSIFAKEKNANALQQLINLGYRLNLKELANPLFNLAKEGNVEAVEFLIEQFNLGEDDAAIAYGICNTEEAEEKIAAILKEKPIYEYKVIYGYALANNKDTINALLKRKPALKREALEAFAKGGEHEAVKTICQESPFLIYEAIKAYIESQQLEPVLDFKSHDLVAELCGSYDNFNFLQAYIEGSQLDSATILRLEQIFKSSRMPSKKECVLHALSERVFTEITLKLGAKNKTYRFYRAGRSAEDHDNYRKTWFPMRNCLASGYVEKPEDVYPGHYPYEKFYPEMLLDFINSSSTLKFITGEGENSKDALLKRFGNFDCLCISFLIGGGYWSTKDSEPLKSYLLKHFKKKLIEIGRGVDDLESITTINSSKIPQNKQFKMVELPYILSQLFPIDSHYNFKPLSLPKKEETKQQEKTSFEEEVEKASFKGEVEKAPEDTYSKLKPELDTFMPEVEEQTKQQEKTSFEEKVEKAPEATYLKLKPELDTFMPEVEEQTKQKEKTSFKEEVEKAPEDTYSKLKRELDTFMLEFEENKSNPNTLQLFFGMNKTLAWQKKASSIRKKAWNFLITEMRKLNEEKQLSIVQYAKKLPLFKDHRSNYALTQNTPYPRVFNTLKEIEKELEHKKEPNLLISLRLKKEDKGNNEAKPPSQTL